MMIRMQSRVVAAGTMLLALIAVVLVGCAAGPGSATGGAGPSGAGATDKVDQNLRKELPASVLSSNTLTLGAQFETPPYISASPNDPNVPIGSVPDLASKIGEVLGLKVQWRNMQWPAQLPGVQSGNVDALWGQVTDTAERERSSVDFVPYQKSSWALLMNKTLAAGITNLAGMCGKRIAVPNGAVQANQVMDANARSCTAQPITILPFQGEASAISAVKSGAADAWLGDTGAQIVAAKNTGMAAVVLPASEVPATFSGVAVGKQSPGLSGAIAGALKALVQDGTYGRVMVKWGLESFSVKMDEIKINPLTGTEPGKK
jgi:polar amino acid transport system substrate-binding protein